MKIALLVGFTSPTGGGWVWTTTRERDISPGYETREEALENRPDGYRHMNDGWERI